MVLHYEPTVHSRALKDTSLTSYLRIVISSANLIAYDYEQVQNIIFLQDFPVMSPQREQSAKGNQFKFELERHLKAMKVPTDYYGHIFKSADFSKAAAWIVASVPGNYSPTEMTLNPIGLYHLSRQISNVKQEEMAKTEGDSKRESELKFQLDHFEFQASSIGTLTTAWLQLLLVAMQGKLGVTTTEIHTLEATSGVKYKLIYPNLKMVQDSLLGYGGFGTIFLSRKAFESKEFPKDKFYSSMSSKASTAVSLHCKIFSAWYKRSIDGERAILTRLDGRENTELYLGYLYHGSHNISAAAWGSLTKKRDKFMIRNYELGVIVGNFTTDKDARSLIPYRVPPDAYRVDQDLPWMQEDWLN